MKYSVDKIYSLPEAYQLGELTAPEAYELGVLEYRISERGLDVIRKGVAGWSVGDRAVYYSLTPEEVHSLAELLIRKSGLLDVKLEVVLDSGIA